MKAKTEIEKFFSPEKNVLKLPKAPGPILRCSQESTITVPPFY